MPNADSPLEHAWILRAAVHEASWAASSGVLVGPGDPHGQSIDPVAEAYRPACSAAPGLFAPERLDQAGIHIHPRTRHDSHDLTS